MNDDVIKEIIGCRFNIDHFTIYAYVKENKKLFLFDSLYNEESQQGKLFLSEIIEYFQDKIDDVQYIHGTLFK